jgi:hypothetical protein
LNGRKDRASFITGVISILTTAETLWNTIYSPTNCQFLTKLRITVRDHEKTISTVEFWVVMPCEFVSARLLQLWRWKQRVPPKRWHPFASPHGVTTQKPTIDTTEPQLSCNNRSGYPLYWWRHLPGTLKHTSDAFIHMPMFYRNKTIKNWRKLLSTSFSI